MIASADEFAIGTGIPYVKVCNAGACVHHSNRLQNGTLWFYVSAQDMLITYFNVRKGSATKQIPHVGAGHSKPWDLKNVRPGSQITMSIQTCYRWISLLCQPYRTVTFIAPK